MYDPDKEKTTVSEIKLVKDLVVEDKYESDFKCKVVSDIVSV